MQEHRATINRQTFRYLERPGTGPVLLCLHGLGDTADQFEPIASRLPEHWRIIALDQRGHGGSWKPERDYSCLDFAADAAGFLDHLGLPATHLFGHSMGGRNGIALAAQQPDRVLSLIIGDIGLDENPGDIEGTTRFLRGLPESFADEAAARRHWAKRKPGYPPEHIDLLMRNLETAADGHLRWRYSVDSCIATVTAARQRDWWELAPRIRCPVLFLHVEGSTEVSEPVGERMRREIPNGLYLRVPGAGHNFHLENPGFAADTTLGFITALDPAASG
jgi:pimeloyl-ACP methyl ester carboxylesterase